jgi:prepilin peptidase dependent protein B
MSILHRQRGLSIVEFMVGIAVGLFIVGGATKLFADYIVSNKRLLLETRVNQDLRAAADIVARDVRRAGYWNNSLTGVWGTGSTTITPNPHATAAGAVSSTATSVSYTYTRDADDVVDSNEYTGFRLNSVNGVNRLEMWDGGVPGSENWQAITDPGTVRITAFSVTPASPVLVNNLSKYCGCLARLACVNNNDPTGATDIANPTFNPAGVPTLTIPSFQIVLTGQAVNDSAITRTVSETVRVRNASLTGSCPP